MKPFENLKLDNWWKVLLLFGVSLMGLVLLYEVDLLSRKHLFGLGLGLFITRLGFNIADKHISEFQGNILFQYKKTLHNPVTILLAATGVWLSIFFTFLIVKELLK